MAMTKEEFLALLTPERRAFMLGCVRDGLADYDDPTNYGAAARRDHTPSVRAHCRNAHIVARATRRLVERPDVGVRISPVGRRVLFIVADRARVSFKKFDRRLRPRNYPTRQALAFNGQRLPSFDTATAVTNVVVGYRSNATETAFEVFATCPQDEENEWQLKLSGAEIIDFFERAPAARSDDASLNLVSRRRVQVRKDAKEASDEHGARESGA